jgi:hypothetical protein
MNVGLSWVLRRPIETTRLIGKFTAQFPNAAWNFPTLRELRERGLYLLPADLSMLFPNPIDDLYPMPSNIGHHDS